MLIIMSHEGVRDTSSINFGLSGYKDCKIKRFEQSDFDIKHLQSKDMVI